MSREILIVGHGYVGAALAAETKSRGYGVTAVNRSEGVSQSYPVLAGDVSDQESIMALGERLSRWPGAIVACASSGRGGADAYRAVFLDGIANLVAAFPDVPVLFTSSTSVYGQEDGSVVDESSPTEPGRETGRILLEAEALVRASGGTVLRLAGIYGPGRSIYLKRILGGTATIEAGEISRILNQIHRDDIVAAILHLIEADTGAGRCFNVVDDTPLTQRECYERLAAFLDLPIPPEREPDRGGKRAWTNKVVSNAVLRKTGWEPHYPSFLTALKTDAELVPSIRRLIS